MQFIKDVENKSVSLRLRKSITSADIASHSILTENIFSFVDFWFKTHNKRLKDNKGKKVEEDYSFYWNQAKCFYKAAKTLPIESAPLPMYYCMLNAIKAYLFYTAKNYEEVKKSFGGHGLHEVVNNVDESAVDLDSIFVSHDNWGVFSEFAKALDEDFNNKWKCGKDNKKSIKELMYYLSFIHSAYISTYNLPRKKELFIPLVPGSTPTYKYAKDRKIRIVVDLDKRYFKKDAIALPKDVEESIPECFVINPEDPFQLFSQKTFRKTDILSEYSHYRMLFSYIAADKRIWYLMRENSEEKGISNLNSMIVTVAIVHRFSEIVRYKPEQMNKLLKGKESWLIHEFLSMALDQFIDEISCEITKKEIMATKTK